MLFKETVAVYWKLATALTCVGKFSTRKIYHGCGFLGGRAVPINKTLM
jgi:hypothetical protein